MLVKIVLDPRLNISAETLANAWNADPEATAIGTATVETETATSFDPFGITALVIVTIVGIGAGALSQVIHNLIDKAMEDHSLFARNLAKKGK